MQKVSKKILSVAVAFVLILGIFSAVLPTLNLSSEVKAEATDWTYDEGTYTDVTAANKAEYGITELGGIALLNNEGEGSSMFRGIHPGYGSLGADWNDSATASYVIYKVKPGSKFTADFYMYQTGKKAFENAGHDFDFKIEACATLSGTYGDAVTTDSYTATNFSIRYTVPDNCNYVKITFPQKGKLSGEKGARGNDYARLLGVKFIYQ